MPSETRWPLRARFAHWVAGMLADWLALAPVDEEWLEWLESERISRDDAIYLSGLERGYEEAREDARRANAEW